MLYSIEKKRKKQGEMVLVVDFAASTGGAMTILEQYYNKAIQDKKNDYVFLLCDKFFKETKNVRIKVLKKEKKWLNRIKFDHFTGRKIVKTLKPDKIFSLQNTIIRGVSIPQTVYIHQPLPFQSTKNFSVFKKEERKLAVIQRLIGREIINSAKKADKVIVQTHWMKDAVLKKCGITGDKVVIEKPEVIIQKSGKKAHLKSNHFFYPTSNVVYKNNNLIYEAVKILEDRGYDDFVVELTIDGESTRHIKKIGKIPREKVLEKYKESVLLFPSYIETFGLPLLEARESNTGIIASDTEFSKEILNGYRNVTYINPFDGHGLADAMETMLKGVQKNKSGQKNENLKTSN